MQCYLNSAINVLFSTILVDDTFYILKLRGPLTNQIKPLCGSYPSQVRRLYLIPEAAVRVSFLFILLFADTRP